MRGVDEKGKVEDSWVIVSGQVRMTGLKLRGCIVVRHGGKIWIISSYIQISTYWEEFLSKKEKYGSWNCTCQHVKSLPIANSKQR